MRTKIKVTAQAVRGTAVIANNEKVSEVILVYNEARRRVFAYDTEEIATNLLGFVQSVEDEDGNALAVDPLVDVIAKGYKATIESLESGIINLVIIPAEVKKKAIIEASSTSEVGETITKIVDAGILTKEECDVRYNYLTDLDYVRVKLPEDLIRSVFNYIYANGKRQSGAVIAPRTLYKDKYSFVDEYKEKSIIAVCLNKTLIGQHTMYVGDKSVGKTVMVETVNWILNKPMQRVQANDKVTEESLFGMKTTAPAEIMTFTKEESIFAALLSLKAKRGDNLTDEELMTVARWEAASARSQAPMIIQEPGPLTLALTLDTVGCTLNVEEANMLQPNAMAVLNNCNDGSKFVQTASGQLKIGQGYTFMGTQNAGKSYTGINKQNAASMSRLAFIRFPYNKDIKDILEVAVSDRVRERLTKGYFDACNKFYMEVMLAFNKPTPQVSDDCLNIRGLVRALEEVASVNIGNEKTFKPLIRLKEAIKTNVVDVSERDKDNNVILEALGSISDSL